MLNASEKKIDPKTICCPWDYSSRVDEFVRGGFDITIKISRLEGKNWCHSSHCKPAVDKWLALIRTVFDINLSWADENSAYNYELFINTDYPICSE